MVDVLTDCPLRVNSYAKLADESEIWKWYRWSVSEPPVCKIISLLGQVEAVKVHDLGPRRDKVFYELLLRITRSVNFGKSTKL